MSRPSKYSSELADDICQRLAHGETLRRICEDDDMPAKSTVFRWLNEREDFRRKYELAQELRVDHWATEILDLVNNVPDLEFSVAVARQRKVKIDALKWLIAKMASKK